MTQQETTQRLAIRGAKARVNPAPEISVRLVGALLALAVATVHIADQGTITALTSPHWIGWGYRFIEVGGVLTAFAVLLSRPAWMGWAAGTATPHRPHYSREPSSVPAPRRTDTWWPGGMGQHRRLAGCSAGVDMTNTVPTLDPGTLGAGHGFSCRRARRW